MPFHGYDLSDFHDEMFEAPDRPRPGCALLARKFEELGPAALAERQRAAERLLRDLGITFNVYGHEAGEEKIFPFDVVPRVITQPEWQTIERGLRQRVLALNLFIDDVYHEQKVLKDGVVPRETVLGARSFLAPCMGLDPPKKIWCHVTGTDLVRDRDGRFFVLEDNLRCPSGVSYVLENRAVMKRTFPVVFQASRVMPVDEYPSRLLSMLRFLGSRPERTSPTCVVLTPGTHNSAYFEHAFLAQQMGAELVEGRDLVVHGGYVGMRTTRGLQRVDVIYRRIDDTFLDPDAFRADSLLGVRGLLDVYRRGNVALANAPGTGVADDKVVYAYVPAIIKYYLGEDPILPNVPTFVCSDDKQRAHVIAHIGEMVVKPANESGGYGILVGPQASEADRQTFRDRIRSSPRDYIAQPMLGLSRVPTLVEDRLEGRHVDLRPYVLYGEGIWVLPGGLTRVALRKGSCVVNSSQGGGSKDTWVLQDDAHDGEGPPC